MNDECSKLLSGLPEPEAPATMATAVMARIAREAEAADSAVAAPVRREWPAWVLALIGALSAGVLFAMAWTVVGQVPVFLSPNFGSARPAAAPMEGPMLVVMALTLLTFFAGLFAPLRAGRRR
jgi:hypothetical protein